LLYGIKPAIVAIVLFAAYRIGSRTLKNKALWSVSGTALVAVAVFHVPFPAVILAAGLIGYFGSRLAPHHFKTEKAHGFVNDEGGSALLDDSSPIPSHALFSWTRLWRVAAAGLFIWLSTMGILFALYGWSGPFTQMGWFFTKAALLTFGGAYAVLPYVYQGAVEHYLWLTPGQMMDGLALGETTPGPLIMVVTFVGFVAGWVTQVFGAEAQFGSAFMSAVIVTFFTFLPSFVFIFVGGPFIETTHGKLAFTMPLRAITAAVVGVIFNLALFFAYHVLWPRGLDESMDVFSLGLTVIATVAVFRFNIGMISAIISCGLFGMTWRLLA
jgi:chromate transporter